MKTLKVKQLVALLQTFDQDANIQLEVRDVEVEGGGYTNVRANSYFDLYETNGGDIVVSPSLNQLKF